MTAADRFDRLFADMLADVAQPAYPDYIDDVLDQATRGSQRPAWTFPERWIPMRTLTESVPFAPRLPWRTLGVAALLLLIAAIVAVAVGTRQRLAPPYGLAANGQIAYMVDGDIYLRDAIDGQPRLVIGGDALDVYPFFALDGSKLAFIRVDREGTDTAPEIGRLFVAKADGTDAHAVFGPTTLLDAAWSPTGGEIAVVDDADGTRQLSIVDVASGEIREIPFDGTILGRVFWRPPDGHELVFLARTNLLAPGFYTLATDGTAARRITSEGTTIPETGNIELTPDGRSIVYMNMSQAFNIRLVDIESGQISVFGRELPPLTPGPAYAGGVQVSPDGTKLVFGRYWDGDGVANLINHQLWAGSLASDGADAVAISPVIRSQGGVDPFLVQLAPDGSQILINHLETDETWVRDYAGRDVDSINWGIFYDTDWQRTAP
jgi:Tol biopolymer transport system component